ncbi:BnaC03g64180D [Brassica napus]|uniref:BnaC03g64180D protein n=1 Tax=Brassica napus TaxID=3708 RepID=A0A078IB91_BRANA|nr:BnaC03g64180D [Brassica napus]
MKMAQTSEKRERERGFIGVWYCLVGMGVRVSVGVRVGFFGFRFFLITPPRSHSSDSEDEEEEEEEEIEKEGEKEGGIRKKKKIFLDEEADEVPIAGEADTYEFDPVQGSFTANNTFAKNLNSLVSSLSSLTPKFMASTASLPETHLENQLTQLPFVEEKSKDMIVSDVFRQLQETSPSCIQGRKRILCGTHTVCFATQTG